MFDTAIADVAKSELSFHDGSLMAELPNPLSDRPETVKLSEETIEPGPTLAPLVSSDDDLSTKRVVRPSLVRGYEIVGNKPLGEGGMGVVWKAEQISTRRLVALKVMSAASFGSDRARRRFEREVELTAKLDHPNIARIYDSGLCDGICFYAMELIQGTSLDEFQRSRHLLSVQLIELMIVICRAVQFAHQKGIIHRDLKPSNILVDDEGRPHVLDFGLAKALDGGSQLSLDGEVAGTPLFMSPEQAEGRVDLIDTRCDVYTLGVILFYLLTGQYPHDDSGSAAEVMRRIREQESRRLRTVDPTANRELEIILDKAMARDAERRYASAGELADDLDRLLRGDPLNARPATISYILAKKLRKFRVPIAVAAGMCLVLLAMGVWSYVRVREEKNQAVRLKGLADTNAALAVSREADARHQEKLAHEHQLTAEANARIATEQRAVALGTIRDLIFQVRDTLSAPGLLPVKKAVFELALTRLQQIQKRAGDFESDRDSAVARQEIGDILDALGKTSEASDAYEQAIKISENILRADPGNQLVLNDLAVHENRLGIAAHEMNDFDAARAAFQKSMDYAQKVLAKDPGSAYASDALTNANGNIGKIFLDLGNITQAIPYCEKSLKEAEASPADQVRLEEALLRIGRLSLMQGKLPESLDYCRRAAAIAEIIHHEQPQAYNGLAEVEMKMGDLTAAENHFEKSLAITETSAASDPANQQYQRLLSKSCENLGRLHIEAGDLSLARNYFERDLKSSEGLLNANPANEDFAKCVGVANVGLGDSLRDSDPAAAGAHYLKALTIFDKIARNPTVSDGSANVATAHARLARTCSMLGDYKSAIAHEEKAIPLMQAAAEQDPANASAQDRMARAYVFMGDTYAAMENAAEARKFYEKARTMCQSGAGVKVDDPEVQGDLWAGMGRLATVAHNPAEAKGFFQQNLAIRQSLAKSNSTHANVQLAAAYYYLGECDHEMNDNAAADELKKAAEMWETAAGKNPEDLGRQHDLCRVYNYLGDISVKSGATDETRRIFTRQLPMLEAWAKANPADRWVRDALVFSYSSLADASYKAHDNEVALQNYLKLLSLKEADHKAAPADATQFHDVWFLYRRIGVVYRTERQLPQATNYFEKFLGMSQEWAQREPVNPKPLFAVAEGYMHMGTVKELAEDYRAATDVYEQGLAVAKTIDEKWNYKDPGYLQVRETLQSHAENCRKLITPAPSTQP